MFGIRRPPRNVEQVAPPRAEFSEQLRAQILHAAKRAEANEETYGAARQTLIEEAGRFYLVDQYDAPPMDLVKYLMLCDHSEVPKVIEALVAAFDDHKAGAWSHYYRDSSAFQATVNTRLREAQVGYELVGGKMVEQRSRELHAALVEPTLKLLAEPGWESVERAYQAALREIAAGDPGDAITDAGTALQEALSLLGAKGKSLGPLIDSAVSSGIIAGYDSHLLKAASHWVSADRSNKGDAHNSQPAQVEDAWFTVHVVGAILLRLSSSRTRGDRRPPRG